MATSPTIQLSLLRDIGWSLWDPIGLRAVAGFEGGSASDEYDGYLLHVVGLLRSGARQDVATHYLADIEARHMGLGVRGDTRKRALETVRAVEAYLASDAAVDGLR